MAWFRPTASTASKMGGRGVFIFLSNAERSFEWKLLPDFEYVPKG